MDKHITLPLTEETVKSLRTGDYVYLTGTIYTARDAAHKRMYENLHKGETLPIEINGNVLYYMGPSPARPGKAIGSAGPTTSSRMDKYTPDLLDLGLRGIIGKGKIVTEFLPQLAQVEGLEVVALMASAGKETETAQFCAEHGISHCVGSLEEMCRLGVDTAYVATPNSLHFSHCKAALELGLNVICEKPMCANFAETKTIADLAKEKNLFLFEAITTLHLPNFHTIRQLLPRIGEIKLVQSHFCQYSSRYDAFAKGEIHPVFDPQKAGGTLLDLGVYNLFFVMGLFGMPESVQYLANVDRGIDTSGILTMKYPDFAAVCVAAKECAGNSGCLIQGTLGVIRTQLQPSRLGEIRLELNDGTMETCIDDADQRRAEMEFKIFADAIARRDYDFCYGLLEKSLEVAQVMTQARLQAGVIFPCDEL